MESKYAGYSLLDSVARINEVLGATDASFEEVDSIPSRDRLTFSNGFYVNCSALFIDIRKSAELNAKHKRPVLSRLYRAYVSEAVAVVNGNINCAEVNIVGDSVSAIFDTPYKSRIDGVFNTAAELASLVDVLNCRMSKVGMPQITVGIGLSWGRALMVKAGYRGSAINDVVWLGPVVNEAAHLCSYASRTWNDGRIMVSSDFYSNLNDENRRMLQYHSGRSCYQCNVVNVQMNDWVNRNCP